MKNIFSSTENNINGYYSLLV